MIASSILGNRGTDRSGWLAIFKESDPIDRPVKRRFNSSAARHSLIWLMLLPASICSSTNQCPQLILLRLLHFRCNYIHSMKILFQRMISESRNRFYYNSISLRDLKEYFFFLFTYRILVRYRVFHFFIQRSRCASIEKANNRWISIARL